ncbi:hypothetical protein NHX12_026537 [Muraenolepis orangiensis]|uniref:Reverse transcriptase domain-containing protein n=1 Tax=Muraenolepis orangiensis TaxID=630683 RepID=A0A9Q0EMG0_9TELE|nr:hypothetical protein NHX12_026537 [Muraenolepis orangiensis]
MDAPSRYFFGLEKKQGQNNLIHWLLSDTGQEITDSSQIRRRTIDFYSSLYTSEYKEDEDLFKSFCEKLPKSCDHPSAKEEEPAGHQELAPCVSPVEITKLSKALANRLREVMDQVVHRDQAYCVPGRSIVDNVCLIRDVLEVSASLGLDTGLISIDQEKAFDRVGHRYLWKVMESFGFSAGLIARIKVLYQDIESVLKFNGGLCAPFKVG